LEVAISSATASVASESASPVSTTVVTGAEVGAGAVVGAGGSNVVGVSGRKVVGGSGPGPVLTVEDGSLVDVVVGITVVEVSVVEGAVVAGEVDGLGGVGRLVGSGGAQAEEVDVVVSW
jgi:hypothetical protein